MASLLLGMLMTVLTMIFSQSSIAWRTGVAGVMDMDNAREDISDLRFQSDNLYEWNGEHYIQSVFGKDGKLRTVRDGVDGYLATTFAGTGSSKIEVPNDNTDVTKSYKKVTPSAPSRNGRANYIVNVRSWGPDKKESTRYDNVYSVSPTDDPGEW